MGQLAEIQKMIDECNEHCGCDDKCTKEEQEDCWKLMAHKERIRYCTEKDLPVERW